MAASVDEQNPTSDHPIQNTEQDEQKQQQDLTTKQYADEDEDEDVSAADEDNEDDADADADDDEEEEEPPLTIQERMLVEKSKLDNILRNNVRLRVHDVIIKGNKKTKDSLIESETESLKTATTVQELLELSKIVNFRLRELEIFDEISITLDSGPLELPGTANVIVEVVESANPLTGDIGIFSKAEARSWSLEGSIKLKNICGYGDIWDGSWAYGWDQNSEISAGVSFPKVKGFSSPLTTRISLLSQDWLKFSSYKERLLGLSVGLISSRYHDLAYNLTWRTLTDPSQMASKSTRMQLGHSMLSSLKYTFKLDRRDSTVRPTHGYAFVSSSQIGGLSPDSRSLRFLRQEFDLRYAFPLGFYHAALNFGISVGAIFPWGSGFMNRPSPLPDKFFLGGHSSPVCSLGGPRTLLGFKSRGVGPTDLRRLVVDKSDGSTDTSLGSDFIGGDLALTAFADLSFDLPLKVLRDAGFHGHLFASAGNLTNLTENAFRNFSLRKFGESFRSSVGAGIIIPTKIFRMEVNYCYIVKQLEHDRGKTGVQFSFSSPF